MPSRISSSIGGCPCWCSRSGWRARAAHRARAAAAAPRLVDTASADAALGLSRISSNNAAGGKLAADSLGQLLAIAQEPAVEGADAVQQGLNAIEGKPVTKQIATPLMAITPQNMDSPTIKPFIYASTCG
ncbi:MAG TPA: hypothetical protein VK586_08210 [Streptosporangiaceae bacterium]|nr:hypothetical protein [Streptosporangiaceae bacterium]